MPCSQVAAKLLNICELYGLEALYAFGSRAHEALELVCGEKGPEQAGEAQSSDLDIGVKLKPGRRLSVEEKVCLALALEDLFGVGRVDLVLLEEADPFLAANIVRGERLYERDPHLADEYELYVLRRAGDLAPLERERLELVLRGEG